MWQGSMSVEGAIWKEVVGQDKELGSSQRKKGKKTHPDMVGRSNLGGQGCQTGIRNDAKDRAIVLCELKGETTDGNTDTVHTRKRLNQQFAGCFNALNFHFVWCYLNLALALQVCLCAGISFFKKKQPKRNPNPGLDFGLSEDAGLKSAAVWELIGS